MSFGKKSFGNMSVRRKVIRLKVRSAKSPFDEKSFGKKSFGKKSFGNMSVRRKGFDKKSFGKKAFGELSGHHISGVTYLCFYQYFHHHNHFTFLFSKSLNDGLVKRLFISNQISMNVWWIWPYVRTEIASTLKVASAVSALKATS